MGWFWLLGLIGVFFALAYQRASAQIWSLCFGGFLILMMFASHHSFLSFLILLAFAAIQFPLYASDWRRNNITSPILKFYLKAMPTMSRTEQEALTAGTVGWEGEIFKGSPRWDNLLSIPAPSLTSEEQAFISGPVERLCKMLDDWDITHNRADLPPDVWQFLKDEGFFSLIIPKQYGGKEFSAYAHSAILTMVYGRSAVAATTVAVPNSLGPAELLLHYGTDEQKNYYLPRLAKGEEVPCFALTAPEAGSDAGAMLDKGIVTWGEIDGKKVLGMRLNWNKRYITLAPVATVIGLAFKLYDPEHLLGAEENLGITCALIPRDTPGVTIGRRHFPCNVPFQNGPTQGHDVFVPLDYIIGGPSMVGQGWRMLMECLAAGRAISLPSSGIGGGKVLAYAAGAYARVRKQFNVPIGRFEGIEEVLARIAGLTYIMDATRSFTASIIDTGEKPAVASAITKYHVTEMGRILANDAMDIHGGKGICLGPKNYLGRFYQSVPIAITVEGANILTRNLIIFGQGAMRCHPYILQELECAQKLQGSERLKSFDKILIAHLSFTLSNIAKTITLGFTSGRIVKTPHGRLKRLYQKTSRYSAAFAFLTDVSLLVFGGALKRKENISARLGDILSYLYLLSAVLKHYTVQGMQDDDFPIVQWAGRYCLYQCQQRFLEVLRNYPNKWLGRILKWLIFPLGAHVAPPSDKLQHKVASLLLDPTPTRARLAKGAYLSADKENGLALLEDAFQKVIIAEPCERILKKAQQDGGIKGDTMLELAKAAKAKDFISQEQLLSIVQAEEARSKVIAVDDFASEDLMRTPIKKTRAKESNLS